MKIHHLAVRTRQLDACVAFYRDVIGLHERKRTHRDDGSTRSVWLDLAGAVFMIECAEPDERSVAPGTLELFAFEIEAEEMAAWQARLKTAGIAVEASTEYTLYLRDPDGRRIGFSSYRFNG